MTKYSESQKQSEPLALHALPFELPDGRDFLPRINRRAPAGFLDFCASYLPKLRQRPDYRQRRLETCCDFEFDLNHPERTPASYPVELLDLLLKGL
jgi:hypothetical protein